MNYIEECLSLKWVHHYLYTCFGGTWIIIELIIEPPSQERIWLTIWATSFWNFFQVHDKKSQNDSEGEDLAQK